MELKDYLIMQVKFAHDLLNAAIKDTPQELVNTKPSEQGNTIGAAYAHVVAAEDYFVNAAILGKARLWESEWQQKLGLSSSLGRDWAVQIPDLAAFNAYAQAVQAATDAYLSTITPDELDRVVKVFNGERPVGRLIAATIVNHACGHAGEIATLKSMQGMKGTPI